MKQNDLKEMLKQLEQTPLSLELFVKLEGYYYYYNWQSDQENKLHMHNCGHCSFGAGKRANASKGENGVWIGPFKNISMAESSLNLQLNIPTINKCRCIIN